MTTDPFTLGAIAFSTVQAVSRAKASAGINSTQATYQRQQAERSRAINAARNRQVRRELSRERAALRAQVTSSGVVPSLGSALLLREDQAASDEFDSLLAYSIGLQDSLDTDHQSRLSQMRARSSRQQGLLSLGEGAMRAGSHIYRKNP